MPPLTLLRQAARTFGDWGIPTAVSIIAARDKLSASAGVIGGGGIETGLDSARAIAIGADISGFARPILKRYMEHGVESAEEYIETHIYELKMTMMLTGAGELKSLRSVPRVYTGTLAEYLTSLNLI